MGSLYQGYVNQRVIGFGETFFCHILLREYEEFMRALDEKGWVSNNSLKKALDSHPNPEAFKDILHFYELDIGLRCKELPDMITEAHRSLIIRENSVYPDNPGYHFLVSPDFAKHYLKEKPYEKVSKDDLEIFTQSVIDFTPVLIEEQRQFNRSMETKLN